MRHFTSKTITSLLAIAFAGSAAWADGPAPAASSDDPAPSSAFAERCRAMNNVDLQHAADSPGVVVEASVDEGRPAVGRESTMFWKRGHVQGNPTPKLQNYPEHCRVDGYVTPQVKFHLVLPPPAKWNGRFMLAACDAWCGKIMENAVVPGLHAG